MYMYQSVNYLFLLVLCVWSLGLPIVRSMPSSSGNATQASELSAAGSEGYIIVAGGYQGNGDTASCYAYDIAAGTWSTLPNLPSSRHGGGMVAQQGNVYYVSGLAGTSKNNGLKQVIELKTAEKAWIEGPPLRTIASNGVNALSLDSSLYALGTYDNPCVEKFDCSSGSYTWHEVASTQKTHHYSGAAVLNGYIYVCGTTWHDPSTFCERYDPKANKWNSITPMNEAREMLSMVSLNGCLYVIGGADANNERYDPVKNEWSYFSSVSNQEYLQAAATDGKKIYVVGGGPYTPDFNVYIPEFDMWQKKGPYPISIRETAAVFVKSLP